ncbi:hypothetical protein [Cellulomonas sp. C5510]|uniref:hypothetical protein n=1 Tax=Cellulomonas sp. C5510 TaxID=2871170 RepID=UPI001C96E5E1|nr:hypothetical protein [Cellulomonas sp. C5510]QZN86899.1 hypothetical protein K5O09_07250 [Cellulomonas sp. C5510]
MRDYVQDQWAPLAHIPELTENRRPSSAIAPTWIDDVDARRLTAYRVLSAMRDNTRRYWLPESMWAREVRGRGQGLDISEAPAASYREYGDAALLVDTARALLLGDDQTIGYPEGTPDAFQTWLDEWMVKERVEQKLLEGEENAIGDGDGVFVLGWSAPKTRPTLRVYDPGFYFPDEQTTVPGWEDDEFPPIVHVAWEWIDPDGKTWIRRQTWRLTPLGAPVSAPWGGTRAWTCLYRSVDYDASERLPKATVYSPELTTKPYRRILTGGEPDVDGWVDMGVDFIPVVHVPNDASTQRTFGSSLLTRIAQILDDIGNTDTDLAAASQQAAPALVTTGVPAGGLDSGPGQQWAMPAESTAGFLDTSKNLTALREFSTDLLDRLATNSRLALALLGRVQPNDVPSGYALSLGFQPARQLLREMRTVRDEKYPLILKFAMRLAQAAGALPAAATPAATIDLGTALPSDLPVAIDMVKDLLPAHAISTPTAVKVLQQAGLPIEDAKTEIEAIKQEWFDQAVKLVEATGNVGAAAALLGIQPATTGATE